MDNNIIIAVIIGLIVGIFVGIVLKLKKSVAISNVHVNAQDQDILKKTIEGLEREKAALIKKISTSENLLNAAQEVKVTDDTKKLMKELKNLKDELEDVEDELEDEKRSNRKIREEKYDLEEEKDLIEKDLKLLTEENEALEKEKNKMEQVSEQNNESLTFINNILNANNSSNKDFEKLDNDTKEICLFIEKNIIHYFDQPEKIYDYAREWRNSELKDWLKNKKKIAVVGEFSAGKTSIINRILSQDNPNAQLLPVSSKETTAIPTYISKSKDFNCQFLSPDNELRNVNKETFGMVTKSVLDKVNISHLIKYFVLSYDNKYLDNLSILDTPGFASNSDDIIKRTVEVVREADAVFWVIDANTGDINQTSIEVMENYLGELPLYFVINKSDTKSPGELDQLEAKIKQTAIQNKISFKDIIRFSQKENVDVLMQHIYKIEIQKQEPLMKHILNILDKIVEDLKEEIQNLREERKKNFKELDQTESNFKTIQIDVFDSAKTIESLVKTKESFFTGIKYQIDKLDYDDFQKGVKVIVELSRAIKEQVEFHTQYIKQKIEIETAFKDKTNQFKSVLQIKKEFIKLITDYNANLLN